MTTRSKRSLMSIMTGNTGATSDKGQTLPMHEPSSAHPSDIHTQKHQTTLRGEMAVFLGEFIGTFMFLFLAFSGTQIAVNAVGTQQLTPSDNPAPDVGKLLYIAFAFGVSLAINVAIFADVSGGMFNPAVRSPYTLCFHHPYFVHHCPWQRIVVREGLWNALTFLIINSDSNHRFLGLCSLQARFPGTAQFKQPFLRCWRAWLLLASYRDYSRVLSPSPLL
jgi:hypothetical protein